MRRKHFGGRSAFLLAVFAGASVRAQSTAGAQLERAVGAPDGCVVVFAPLQPALTNTNPVVFNRGMAALFLGEPQQAVAHFRLLDGQLPEDSAWRHLAGLYLGLAEMRAA